MTTDEKLSQAGGPSAKGGSRKSMIIVLAALVVAGAAYFLFVAGGEADETEPVAGEVLALESVAVNLAGGGYLKVGIALQLVASDAEGHGAGSGPSGAKATDLIISTFSQAQPADVSGARDALKEALEEKIIEAYDGEVMGIYYTEYVTQ